MRILYDYQAFDLQVIGGVSRCFAQLYNHLPQEVDSTIGIRESDNKYIQNLIKIHPRGYGYDHFLWGINIYGKGHLHLWSDIFRKHKYYPNFNQNYCIELLKKGDFDVFHPTYFNDYFLPYLKEKPFVLSIHDMIPERFEGLDNWQKEKKAKLANLAAHIIAVSHNTKKDIIELLNIPEEKITVVYHAVPDSIEWTNNSPFNFPYILYVGSRYTYKNFFTMLHHLHGFLKKHSEVRIVCTGPLFSENEKHKIALLGLSNVVIHHFAQEDELYNIYHHALCFVYPSSYEGFGIPILEAYKAECPVLLNHASCFPEIAGDAAVYFTINENGSNISEMLELIVNYTREERNMLINKQKQRLSLYSWTSSALQLSKIYQVVRNCR